jgi:hypothetical protein
MPWPLYLHQDRWVLIEGFPVALVLVVENSLVDYFAQLATAW